MPVVSVLRKLRQEAVAQATEPSPTSKQINKQTLTIMIS